MTFPLSWLMRDNMHILGLKQTRQVLNLEEVKPDWSQFDTRLVSRNAPEIIGITEITVQSSQNKAWELSYRLLSCDGTLLKLPQLLTSDYLTEISLKKWLTNLDSRSYWIWVTWVTCLKLSRDDYSQSKYILVEISLALE